MEERRKHHHFLSFRHSSSPKMGTPSEASVSILPSSLPHLSETSQFPGLQQGLRAFWPIARLGGDGAHPDTWSLSNLGFPASAACSPSKQSSPRNQFTSSQKFARLLCRKPEQVSSEQSSLYCKQVCPGPRCSAAAHWSPLCQVCRSCTSPKWCHFLFEQLKVHTDCLS